MGKMLFCLFVILWKYTMCFLVKFTLPLTCSQHGFVSQRLGHHQINWIILLWSKVGTNTLKDRKVCLLGL